MAPELFLPFLTLALLSEITPGPNMALLALVSARWGWRAGMMMLAGITAGLVSLLAIAIAALVEVIAVAPWAFETIRWAGVAYLLWLAIDLWRGGLEPKAADGALPSPRRLALRGFVINLLNPKAAAFYMVVLPGFTRPQAGDLVQQAAMLGAAHLAISIATHTSIVFAASGMHPMMRDNALRHGRHLMRRVLAIAMAAIALWLAWETRAA
ncbi:MAG TPA: LysE family translocator [Caulobacteraceae bacterium]